eukprot:m.79140 g.79140  ORF g.79140 m.79140 type:complete len:752 (+) comp13270_c0_seq2:191-2446(+)
MASILRSTLECALENPAIANARSDALWLWLEQQDDHVLSVCYRDLSPGTSESQTQSTTCYFCSCLRSDQDSLRYLGAKLLKTLFLPIHTPKVSTFRPSMRHLLHPCCANQILALSIMNQEAQLLALQLLLGAVNDDHPIRHSASQPSHLSTFHTFLSSDSALLAGAAEALLIALLHKEPSLQEPLSLLVLSTPSPSSSPHTRACLELVGRLIVGANEARRPLLYAVLLAALDSESVFERQHSVDVVARVLKDLPTDAASRLLEQAMQTCSHLDAKMHLVSITAPFLSLATNAHTTDAFTASLIELFVFHLHTATALRGPAPAQSVCDHFLTLSLLDSAMTAAHQHPATVPSILVCLGLLVDHGSATAPAALARWLPTIRALLQRDALPLSATSEKLSLAVLRLIDQLAAKAEPILAVELPVGLLLQLLRVGKERVICRAAFRALRTCTEHASMELLATHLADYAEVISAHARDVMGDGRDDAAECMLALARRGVTRLGAVRVFADLPQLLTDEQGEVRASAFQTLTALQSDVQSQIPVTLSALLEPTLLLRAMADEEAMVRHAVLNTAAAGLHRLLSSWQPTRGEEMSTESDSGAKAVTPSCCPAHQPGDSLVVLPSEYCLCFVAGMHDGDWVVKVEALKILGSLLPAHSPWFVALGGPRLLCEAVDDPDRIVRLNSLQLIQKIQESSLASGSSCSECRQQFEQLAAFALSIDLPRALQRASELEEHQHLEEGTNLFAGDEEALENTPDCY